MQGCDSAPIVFQGSGVGVRGKALFLLLPWAVHCSMCYARPIFYIGCFLKLTISLPLFCINHTHSTILTDQNSSGIPEKEKIKV